MEKQKINAVKIGKMFQANIPNILNEPERYIENDELIPMKQNILTHFEYYGIHSNDWVKYTKTLIPKKRKRPGKKRRPNRIMNYKSYNFLKEMVIKDKSKKNDNNNTNNNINYNSIITNNAYINYYRNYYCNLLRYINTNHYYYYNIINNNIINNNINNNNNNIKYINNMPDLEFDTDSDIEILNINTFGNSKHIC